MDLYYRRALRNIVRYGDTDIFPFPVENHVFHDQVEETVAIITRLDADVTASLAQRPPSNVGALAPVGYTGFRWATQIDPVWNATYLAWVLSIADAIEAARIPIDQQTVFSYRYAWDDATDSCFSRDVTWRSFIERALHKAAESNFVVSCDISEFYLRINHHRIENAIRHLPNSEYAVSRIRSFLANLSGTYSFGLPVGGPASRLIAELVLSQIDSLLQAHNVDFIRYADDYYFFTDSPDQSFKALVTLTKLLIENQGLQLQKSKTRIMSSAEFIASNPLVHDDENVDVQAPLGAARQALMTINVHYDPYSPTAPEDYERLREELDQYPVMEIIRAELKKSHVNITLARRLVSLSRYLREDLLDDAIVTLIENEEILYPVYFNVLIAAKDVFQKMSDAAKDRVVSYVRNLINSQSRVMVVDINLQYAVRLLSCRDSRDTRLLFANIFREDRISGVKRDIILALAKWNDWHWLSDVKNRFRALSAAERRAFIIGSFQLGDEGEHWRRHVRRELTPDEELVRDWTNTKRQIDGWQIPL